MSSPGPGVRVLAISATGSGWGFFVAEGPASPIDWGTRGFGPRKKRSFLAELRDLLHFYRPAVLVLPSEVDARRSAMAARRLRLFALLARSSGVKVQRVEDSSVRSGFESFEASTRHGIASAIAEELPELRPRLPRKRKPWMGDDRRMRIFEAAALAFTYYRAHL